MAEAIAALRPTWHLLLSDVAPTALFEVNELVNLCRHLIHEGLEFGEPGLLIGTEPHQDINAGMAIFIGSTTRPGVKLQRHGGLYLKSYGRTSQTNRLTSCLQ